MSAAERSPVLVGDKEIAAFASRVIGEVVTEHAVEKWRLRGPRRLQFRRVGGRVCVRQATVRAWLEERYTDVP